METEELLGLSNITKTFGGVTALEDVSLSVKKGEVLSVVGENGAGKSTLMKIIAGVIQPNKGELLINGERVAFHSAKDAAGKGISIVYQEPNLFSEQTVLENMYMGEEIKSKLGNIAWERMYKEASAALKMVDLSPDILNRHMEELSIGTQQLILIAKGIYKKSQLLILDEPTSILSQAESEKLFELIDQVKAKGVSILYISHRIPEILRISDDIVVLRDGKVTEYLDPKTASEGKIISAMSGREINLNIYRPRNYADKEPLIKVSHLGNKKLFQNISFHVKPGEILGVYGLIGSGRSEVARTIFGELPIEEGQIEFERNHLQHHQMNDAVKKGIYYVPEDRGTQGNFSSHSVKWNLSAVFLPLLSHRFGILNKSKERQVVQENIKKYSIKTHSQESLITSLSGGSQQKVLLTRWLVHQPKLLILDEPTRGIDMRTKTEIHELVLSLAEKGVSVILISSELPEVMRLSDNILVMHKGEKTGLLSRDEMTEEKILRLALGLAS
ncbi:sugar ABC transporter ATP-binding protein [Oceanobacillus sp. CFH 90083]|uniref:sugar ABC transporter ATP-binding protein n=1 Tax=Oceanobacillus sp. CFH 90083 TaxID=2592336 RepID=UPI00128CA8C0|nr:sugar ABC transporter ATP-binding protein [Oceanobacillus sp. CFH 90083]